MAFFFFPPAAVVPAVLTVVGVITLFAVHKYLEHRAEKNLKRLAATEAKLPLIEAMLQMKQHKAQRDLAVANEHNRSPGPERAPSPHPQRRPSQDQQVRVGFQVVLEDGVSGNHIPQAAAAGMGNY